MKDKIKAEKRLLPWVGGGCSAHPQPTPPLHQEKGCGKRTREEAEGHPHTSQQGQAVPLIFWSKKLEKVGAPDVPVTSLIHSAMFVILYMEIPSNII